MGLRSTEVRTLAQVVRELNILQDKVRRLEPLFSLGTKTQITRVGVIRQADTKKVVTGQDPPVYV